MLLETSSRLVPRLASRGVLVRPVDREDDVRFVIKSWSNDYTNPRNPWSGTLVRRYAKQAVRDTIIRLLNEPDVALAMACYEKNEDQILGFCCFQDGPTLKGKKVTTLHYIYVKALFRGTGIAKDLLACLPQNEGGLRYTFRTPLSGRVTRGGKYAPNIVRRLGKPEEIHVSSQAT
ncbi:MAG: N-acetyltransferase [Bacteroidetes bacterium]|nr:MAG: N-acetyltransferase [Bacteroidota bacterium]